MPSRQRFFHDSVFAPPKVKRLGRGALKRLHRFIKAMWEAGILTAARKDVALALINLVGYGCREQIAYAVISANAGNVSDDTIGRTLTMLVEAGLLKIHHIIQRGANGGGTVQDRNFYELVAPPDPDPQTAEESLPYGLKAILMAKTVQRRVRRMTQNLRRTTNVNVAEEDEWGRQNQQRQLALLKGG
jgi:hypothetical protein